MKHVLSRQPCPLPPKTGTRENPPKRETRKEEKKGTQTKTPGKGSNSGTGNRTLGCSVRASDVSHYTIPDVMLVVGWDGIICNDESLQISESLATTIPQPLDLAGGLKVHASSEGTLDRFEGIRSCYSAASSISVSKLPRRRGTVLHRYLSSLASARTWKVPGRPPGGAQGYPRH